nr:hypothetical protein [Nocardia terrae]
MLALSVRSEEFEAAVVVEVGPGSGLAVHVEDLAASVDDIEDVARFVEAVLVEPHSVDDAAGAWSGVEELLLDLLVTGDLVEGVSVPDCVENVVRPGEVGGGLVRTADCGDLVPGETLFD